MKKLFTTLAVAAFGCAGVMAQSISLEPHPSTVYGFADEALFDIHFKVANISNDDVDVLVHAPTMKHQEKTFNYFCWSLCYPPFVRSAPEDDFITIPAGGQVDNFIGDYNPEGQIGSTTVEYTFYNKDNEKNDFQTTTITYVSLMPEVIGSGTVCAGESATLGLKNEVYDAYEWSNGMITPTIDVTMAGTYTVTVTLSSDSLGDRTRTAEHTVAMGTGFTPTVVGDLAYCTGETATITVGPGYDTYLWDNNMTTESVTVTDGVYNVTVTKGACAGVAQANVVEHALPAKPEITSSIEGFGSNATVILTATESEEYRWYDDGALIYGEWEQTLEPEEKMAFQVSVNDANGCSSPWSDEYDAINVGVEENAALAGLSVYPNPANDFVQFNTADLTFRTGSITVQNALGAVVSNITLLPTGQTTVNTNELETGLYFYTVILDNAVQGSGQLVVTH